MSQQSQTTISTKNTTPLKAFKPRHKIKAVFWDVDGTLVQTEDLHRQTTFDTFKLYGVTLTDADFESLHGRSMKNNFSYLQNKFNVHELSVEEFYERKCKLFQELSGDIQLTTPNLRTILQKVLDSGCQQAAVSNGINYAVNISINIVGNNYFSFALGIEDTVTGKPSPIPYLMAAKKLGIAPENCLVIEDSGAGIESGLAAGMHVIGCPFYKDIYLKHKTEYDKADLIVDSLDHVDWDAILA